MFLTVGTPVDNSISEGFEQSLKASFDNVIGSKPLDIFKNVEQSMISIMDSAKTLQRNMGGVLSNTSNFNLRIMDTYKETVSLGGSLQDVYDSISSLADGMGKIVSPSKTTLTNMTQLSLATGIATKEIGTMVSEMVRFGKTQQENVKEMSRMGMEARKAGLNAKTYISEIGKNLKSVGSFGFKEGQKGLEKMVKQAGILRTTVDKMGAAGFAADILDPEKAMSAAASFQMLGGAVGKLSDPFQLLHMAQTDMAGLQEEMVNSTKSSFNFANGFKASTEDLYRFREMSKITGQSLEDIIEQGREAGKLDFIEKKFGMSGIPEETKNLITSLATIGEDGSLTVDIPGIGEKTVADEAQLQALLNDADTKKALADYQKNVDLNDSDLAKLQLTVTERQAATVNEIKFAVIAMMDKSEKAKFQTATEASSKNNQKLFQTPAFKTSAKMTGDAVVPTAEAQQASIPTVFKTTAIMTDAIIEMEQRLKDYYSAGTETTPVDDLFVGSGSKPKVMVKNQIYEGIVGDEVAMGTGLSSAFDKSSKLNRVMSQIMSASQQGSEISGNQNLTTLLNGMSSKLSESPQQGSSTVDGKIDININLNGSISGDNGNLEKVFSDPRVQKQIMDTVLYKLKGYTQKQGVLSNNS